MENNTMENKRGSILGYLFLILIILGLAGYIVYDKDLLHLKNEEKSATTEKKNEVKIDYNTLYQIGNTLDYLDAAFNEVGTSFTGYIYKEKKLLASKFSNEAAVYSAIRRDLIASNTRQILANGTVKINFESMYGNYLSYNPKDISTGNSSFISYSPTTTSYSYILPLKTNIYVPRYHTKTVKTETKNDDILVTRKLYYIEYVVNANGVATQANVYKDANKKETIGQIDLRDGSLNDKEVLDKFSSKFNTFIYHFKRKKDDNYSFYSIERIK